MVINKLPAAAQCTVKIIYAEPA